jgi:pilus assembly protein FimV
MVLRKRLFASLSTGLLPLFSASLPFRSLSSVSLLSASLFSSSLSHALIIQPVQVKSALGEPFYAEVALSDLGPVRLQDLSVGMASTQELVDLGVRSGSYNGTLSFNVQPVSSDRGIIVIRGRQPVNEPFVDFVLRVKNGKNTRLQRISAMIDPADKNKKVLNLQAQNQNQAQNQPLSVASSLNPVSLATSTTPTVDIPPSRTESPVTTERRLNVVNALPPDMKPRQTASTASNKPVAPREVEVSTAPKKNRPRHVVKNNESLWKIAKQLEPQLKQPVGQIMQRIRDMNQDAFIAGDPNQLKRGATLILPEREQNTALVTAPQPAPIAKQPPKTPAAPSSAPVNRSGRLPKAELTLVAPNMQGNTQGNSSTGQNVGFQPLPREIVLKIGQERRKTVLMQHEVSELDAQLALNDKKIAMLNAKLAELEHQLKTRNQAKKLPAPKQPMQALPPQKAANAILPVIAFVGMALFGFAPNMARAAEGDGGGFPLWIIIAIAVVVLGLVFTKISQGKSANKRPARGKAKRPATRRPAATAKKEQPVARPVAPAATEAPVPVARPVAQPVATDVLQEVQSYIERDRYTQAVGLLKDAIGKNPERVDLQVKLLEVYALQNDIDGFEQQFNIVTAFNQPETTQHAEKMRMLLQPKPAEDFTPVDDLSFNFESSKPATAENNVIEFNDQAVPVMPQDVDVPTSAADQSLAELEAEFGFNQEPDSPATTQPAADAHRFDLNLDEFETTTPAQRSDTNTTPSTAKAAPQDEPVDLEFDLNDSFILEDVKTPEPAPATFNLELDKPKAPVSTPAAPPVNLENLDKLEVADTNWADGFDDQDFNIGTSTTPAPNASVSITPADTSASPEDFLAKEFPFLVNLDVQQTNLELAESYINLGERTSARELLGEVINQGNPQQQAQAQHLMQKLAS